MPTPQELRTFVTAHFDLRELEIFCFDYFPDVYTNFHGSGKSRDEYSIELMLYCKNRHLENNLAAALQKERPDLYAKKFLVATPPPTPSPSAQDYLRGEGSSQNPKTIWIRKPKPMEMQFMRVEAGEFLMGSDKAKDPNARDDELPQHKVYLDEYYMGRYPVTNAQYAVFAKATGETFELPEGKENHPVVKVSWNDAHAFCEWLNTAQDKYKIALPTEAQWEKAARGIDGRIYPWGNQMPDTNVCNYGENETGATPVGKYSPQGDSPYECADMAGNVWEWCADYWNPIAYKYCEDKVISNPIGTVPNLSRVLRGGSFNGISDLARCACRARNIPASSFYFAGFRVVACA